MAPSPTVLKIGFVLAFLALCFSTTSADVVETSFHVKNLTTSRLCQNLAVAAVNGSIPGPTLRVKEGDTVIVHVFNKSPYNLTIHWHGVFQRQSQWSDGPEFVTQCPIRPGGNYTYRFNITDQVGTLWWHAHSQWLRATVYGALIIRPRDGQKYPFVKPYREDTILLGEWWNTNPIDVETVAQINGSAPVNSDAYTINGWPGDLFNTCISTNTYRLDVVPGRTYLLRIINAALNNQFFFKIANHNLTVVAVDAAYTNPFPTDVIVIGPGQTTDVLLTANQSPGLYYMAAHPYASAAGVPFNANTTTAILAYQNAANQTTTPILPVLPPFNDTPTQFRFSSNLTGLVTGPFWLPVPRTVDENMFVTIGLGLSVCGSNLTCGGIFGQRMAASMNNHSFQLPTTVSLLEAVFRNISGVYTTDFPDQPPFVFDYTNVNNSFDLNLLMTPKLTSVKKVKYNSTVQVVFQNTALIGIEDHPMHLHGFNFYVLAQGFGNYDPTNDPSKFNLVNPQERNTLGVPVGGWAVIRFRANNPGMWFIHCHLDVHLPWGLGTAFLVENGGTPESTLPPPPADFPQC